MSSESPATLPLSAPPAAPPAPAPAAAARTPACVQIINGYLRIPMTIADLESFRQWARSEECPEKGRFAFLDGVLWVDLTMEQGYTHIDPKTEIGGVLRGRAKASGRGRYFGDGMLLTNPAADLSTVPDGLYVTFESLQSGRVRQVPNTRNVGVIELEGTPEMVLEVVSDTSVEKDTVRLPELYHRAGIPEFWRVDARGELVFEVLRRGEAGYERTREPDGWWQSDVFGRAFRLEQQPNPLGQPEFTVRVRELG